MDKVLELSKKIYESGFQPDYIEIGDGLLDLYISGEGVDFEFEDPWFSSDWCWKMLPYKINLHELQTDGVCSEVGYRYYYLDRDDKISCDDLVAFKINDSLHEALLELVYWCIDNKYLIPSNKGELKGKI